MGFYNIMLEGEQYAKYRARKDMETHAAEWKDQEKLRTIDKRAGYSGITDWDNPKYVGKPFNRTWINTGKNNPDPVVQIDSKRSGYTNHNVGAGEYQYDDGTTAETIKYSPTSEDKKRDKAAEKVAKRITKPGLFPDIDKKREMDLTRDAVNRHMRRHPDQWDGDKRIKTRSEACGIFESVEFLKD